MQRRTLIGTAALAVVTAGCLGDGDSDDTDGETNGEQQDEGADDHDEEQSTDGDETTDEQDADGTGEESAETDNGGDDAETDPSDGEEGGDPQLRVNIGDATGDRGGAIDVSLSVEAVGDEAPDEVPGHEFQLDYDETILEPVHESASTISLEDGDGPATYTIGADPDDGSMEFSTLDSLSVPYGPGERLTFEVLTDESATTTITASVSFDVDAGGSYVVEYDSGTIGVN